MSNLGSNFDKAQRHHDNQEDPRGSEEHDCDIHGHVRCMGVPVVEFADGEHCPACDQMTYLWKCGVCHRTGAGGTAALATCKECASLFSEYEDKQRVEKLKETDYE